MTAGGKGFYRAAVQMDFPTSVRLGGALIAALFVWAMPAQAQVAEDRTTLEPSLQIPLPIRGTVELSFSLPEAAKPGSVQLAFRKESGPFFTGVLRPERAHGIFTFGSAVESAGPHVVRFSVTDPVGTSGGAVTSGQALEDGEYQVGFWYQDAAGNPAAGAGGKFRLDTKPPTPFFVSVSPAVMKTGDVVKIRLINQPDFLHTVGGTIGGLPATGGAYKYSSAHNILPSQPVPIPGPWQHGEAQVTITDAVPEGPLRFALMLTDESGNSVEVTATTDGSQVVVDHNPIELALPQNLTAEATSSAGAAVSFQVAVTDQTDPSPLLVVEPPSGSVFPLGTTTVQVRATNGSGRVRTGAFTVTVKDTTPPVVSGLPPEITLVGGVDGQAKMPFLFREPIMITPDPPSAAQTARAERSVISWVSTFVPGPVVYGDAVGVVSRTQSPESGTVLKYGTTYPVTVTVSDWSGNATTVQAVVKVRFVPVAGANPSMIMDRMAEAGPGAKGDLAPGAGRRGGPPAGSTIREFFAPAISDQNDLAARVTLLDGRRRLAGIYGLDEAGGASLPAFEGGLAPNAAGLPSGAKFKSFQDPVLAPNGALAFSAKLQGDGVSGTNDDGVWTDAFGGSLAEALREGGPVPGLPADVRLKSVTSLSLQNQELVALMTLAPGKGGVKATDDLVLLRQTGANAGEVLLREDMELLGDRVKSFTVLSPASLSPGHGRWHHGSKVVAKVALKGGRTVVVSLEPGRPPRALVMTGVSSDAEAVAEGATWSTLALPAQGGEAGGYVVQGTLKAQPGVVTAKDDQALIYSADGETWTTLAREGRAPDWSMDAKWTSFFDPVINDQGWVAFLGTFNGGIEGAQTVLAARFSDAWNWVRIGRMAPTSYNLYYHYEDPIYFTKFLSYALPDGDGSGVLFLAEAAGLRAPKKVGLWALQPDGSVFEVLLTGRMVRMSDGEFRTVSKIAALQASAGVYGVSRSFNANDGLVVLAMFTDGSQALLRVKLPAGS